MNNNKNISYNQSKVVMIKSVDKEYITPGDELSFNIIIKNTGNMDIDELVIKDILPKGIEHVKNSLVFKGWMLVGTLEHGIKIGNLMPKETIEIKFKANVSKSLKSDFPLKSYVKATYEINVNNVIEKYSIDSNDVDLLLMCPNFSENGFKFSVSKQEVDIDEIIKCEFIIKNTGNIIAENIRFKSMLQSNFKYIKDTIIVNGIDNTGLNPEKGLLIDKIDIDEEIKISYEAKAINIEKKDKSYALMEYEYTTCDKNIIKELKKSNFNNIKVLHGEINEENLINITNKNIVTIEEIITCKLVVKNTGNIDIDNINIISYRYDGVEFIEGSLIVNNRKYKEADINNGVVIKNIKTNHGIEVEYKIIVRKNINFKIENCIEIKYQYMINKKCISKNIKSKSLPISIFTPLIKTKYSENKIISNNLLKNRIKIENVGNVTAENIFIKVNILDEMKGTKNVRINGKKIIDDTLKGINLANIKPNEVYILEFDSYIETIPKNKKIDCDLDIDFEWKIPNVEKIYKDKLHENIQYKIYFPKIDIENSVDKTLVEIGEIFKYKIKIKNIGDTDITKIKFSDNIPSEIQITEIEIDGKKTKNIILKELELKELKINESLYVLISAKSIKKIFFSNQIICDIKIFNEDGEKRTIKKIIENEVVKIIDPNILLIQEISNFNLVVGDIFNCKVKIKNNGDVKTKNVFIKNIMSDGLEFIKESVFINSVEHKDENIISGIDIGNLEVFEEIEILFSLKVTKNENIENLIKVYYKYLKGDTEKEKILKSNKINIKPMIAEIEISSKSNLKKATLNDKITYTIKITNTGNIEAKNIIFNSNISEVVKFILGSCLVNNIPFEMIDIGKGMYIKSIQPGKTIKIIFSVVVKSGSYTGYIRNESFVTFDYKVGDKETLYKKSNVSKIDIINLVESFKEMIIERKLSIPLGKAKIESINEIFTKIEITNNYVIRTAMGKSNEGEIITGNKLVINGKLLVTIEYSCYESNEDINSFSHEIYFGTYIVLPKNYMTENIVEAIGKVEGVKYSIIDRKTILIDAVAIFYSRVEN